MDIKSTLYFTTENTLENQIRKSLKETYSNEKPSKKTLNAIMSFAASYDCVDTKIGKVEMVFN
ncbi:MAG: hypothetical protein IKV80_05785 [Bacteroidales bacterium]|nr:hypothetical protein [Bacteroidales bacterium]